MMKASELRSLQTMSSDEFVKMMKEIGKGYKLESYEAFKPLRLHLHQKKMLYGFGGVINNRVKAVFEFKHLITKVKVCDWLDYNGFARPKWTPEGMTMRDTVVLGYELSESKE